jgi:hypothetical protein
LKIKPENLIWTGNTIFAAVSVWQLIKVLILKQSISLPLLNMLSIILGLACFAVSNIMINGFSISKQFQILIQLFCWILILFFH